MDWMRWDEWDWGLFFYENVLMQGLWKVIYYHKYCHYNDCAVLFLVNKMDWMRWMALGIVFHKKFLTQGLQKVKMYYHGLCH